MLRNYLIIALRHFWANKPYVIINIFGLAVGIAICILAYYHFAYNFEFDDGYKSTATNIYRVEKFATYEGRKSEEGSLSYPLIRLIANDAPGIKQVIRYNSTSASGTTANIKIGEKFFEEDVFYADSGFFQVFKFKFIKGNESAFKDKTSILLNERRAKKFFGNQDPTGKTLTLVYSNGRKKDFIVRGVLQDQPFNSSFQFNAIMRFENSVDLLEINESDWTNWRQSEVYLEIPDPKNVPLINRQLISYVKTQNDILKNSRPTERLGLLAFAEVAQHSREVSNRVTAAIITPSFVIMIGAIGILILLIACFNYTNTSIALAGTRIKEISLRKVMGSQRKHIVWQFLLEHLVISVMAVLFSIVLYDFIGNLYWSLWSGDGETFTFSSYKYLGFFIIFILFFTTLISGAYPAFYISKLKTADALRRNLKLKGGNWFTYTLLSFQLIVTIIGLGTGIVFYNNANYIDKMHKGYSVENIIAVPMVNSKDIRNFELYKSKITGNTDILAVAGTSQHISWWSWMEKTKFNDKEYEAMMLPTGEGYLQTMGVKLIQGRFFDKNNIDDTSCVIINEKYAKTANITNPLNESIVLYGNKLKIIGVVGDFMQRGVSNKVNPMTITLTKKDFNIMAVKTSSEKLNEVNKFLEKTWKEAFPDQPYNGYPQRKRVDGEKSEFVIMKKIFLSVATISLALSLIGLYVLISLIISKKNKEIGIRKVLGGSIQNIIYILGKNFIYIFAISTLLGSFLGLSFNNFIFDSMYKLDNHVDITPFTFLFSSLAITVVAAFTIIYKVIKAANANPVQSLRTE